MVYSKDGRGNGMQMGEGDNVVVDLDSLTLKDKPPVHPRFWCGQHSSSPEASSASKDVYNYAVGVDEKEKTPMCQIAELARFHKLKHEYKLLDESGPAHKKLFTVKLVLTPYESYEGSGASIKKAQQAAADAALQTTMLQRPPEKNAKKAKRDACSPTMLLSHVIRRLGMADPIYTISIAPHPSNPLQVISPHSIGVLRTDSSLLTYMPVHSGGATKIEAKNGAATQALFVLAPALAMLEDKLKEERELEKKRKEEERLKMKGVSDNSEEAYKMAYRSAKSKSVISQVHECALHMKLTVEFEVLNEDGQAHDRRYVVQCRLIGADRVLQANGEGRKKKEAKQAACEELIQQLKMMESSPIFIASALYKSQKRNTAVSREPKRKTIVKDMKMLPTYGHEINPVSRLIQVLQAKGEEDAHFEEMGETGQYKYRQFVMRVSCCGESAEGSGPNKRLAKRAAAEAMLQLLGVAKPLPEPGKSLLKRKENMDGIGTMSIGVFDPSQLSPSPSSPAKDVKWEEPRDREESQSPSQSPSDHSTRRRVTFNAKVAACNPPDNSTYPSTELSSIHPEGFMGALTRTRKKDKGGSRSRSLSSAQKEALCGSARAWIEGRDEEEDNVFRVEALSENRQRDTACTRLEKMAAAYRFSLHFTSFPQGGEGSKDARPSEFFALVTLGLENPLMGHGSGDSMDSAYENAARNAMISLANCAFDKDPNMFPSPSTFSPPPPTYQHPLPSLVCPPYSQPPPHMM